jgi:cell division septal protein FtsQ
VLVIAAITFGGIQLFTNERFFVYTAQISGNERISGETIYATSGIDQTNVLWIRPAEIVKRLTALPDIAAAHVRVRLPNQVAIEVQERVPVVAWQTALSTTWIAADGVSLTAVGAPPALTLVDADAVAGDGNGVLRRQVLADLLALHTARPDLTNLYYGRQEGLYFRAPEGWTIYLGGGQMADKLAALQTAQREIGARGAPPDVVDLRFEGKVYLR